MGLCKVAALLMHIFVRNFSHLCEPQQAQFFSFFITYEEEECLKRVKIMLFSTLFYIFFEGTHSPSNSNVDVKT